MDVKMETQYSRDFFASLVKNLQDACRKHLHYNQFVEVSGYVSVEIDNTKKERFVLSELLQSSGNVVSESYCTKTIKTCQPVTYNENPRGRKGSWADRANTQSTMWPSHTQVMHASGRSEQRSFLDNSSNICSTQIQSTPGQKKRKYSDSSEQYGSSKDNMTGSRVLDDDNLMLHYKSIQEEKFSVESKKENMDNSSAGHYSVCDGLAPRHQSDGEINVSSDIILNKFNTETSSACLPILPVPQSRHDTPASCEGRGSNSGPDSPGYTSTEEHPVLQDSSDQQTCDEGAAAVVKDEAVIDLEMDDPDDDVSLLPAVRANDDILRYGTGTGQRKSKLSPGTLTTVRCSVKQFKKFIFEQSGMDFDLFLTPPERLNSMLLDYFHRAKKCDGSVPTARTLKNVQERLDMFLKDGGYPYSVIKDHHFQSSRDYLKKKMSESAGSVGHQHSPVDDQDIELLFEMGQLGLHKLETLTNSLWFMNSKYFAIRRPAEHYNFKWGALTLEVDEQGREYVARGIKNTLSLKVFSKPEAPQRCFVNFYKQYQAMRPKVMLCDSAPFYLKLVRNIAGETFFSAEPQNYSYFLHNWKKMVVQARLAHNKKIF